MRCKLPYKNLLSALKVIKTSKAMGKIDADKEIALKISFDKEENKIEFIASNVGVWGGARILASDFSSYESPEDIYEVNESGEIFIEAKEFISMVETFPDKSILEMFIEEKKSLNNFTVNLLECEKKGKRKTVSFLTIVRPKFFEEHPPNEKREMKIVHGESLSEAVLSVEFASDADPIRQHLWGVQVEIYGEKDIAACATDTFRLCWYDQEGSGRKGDCIALCPNKVSLVSAIKNLNLKENVKILIGEKYTIFEQDNQWHGIPNAIQMGDDGMPEWRSLVKELEGRCNNFVDIPRKPIVDCLKSASVSSGGRYGIKLIFNAEEKNVTFSVENVEENYSVRSYMTETEPLEDDNFGSDHSFKVSFRVEHLKEIVNRYKSDNIRFLLQGDDQAVIIVDKNESYQYISTVIRGQ